MPGTDLRRAAWLALLASAGCAAHSAPAGYLPYAETKGSDPFGSWVEVTFRSTGGPESASGELIGISADTLWLLDAQGGRGIPTMAIVEGKLVSYVSGSGTVAGLTGLGVVSTISNGAFLGFTAPMWLIGGTVATARQSRVPIEELPQTDWVELARYARFPLGLPEGTDLTDLRPRTPLAR